MSVTVCPNGHIHSEHECRLCKPVKKEVCPVCMGTGDDYDYEGGSSMCGACLGTGRVKAALALPSADSSGSDNVPLPSGSGEQPTSVEQWVDEVIEHSLSSKDLDELRKAIAEERRQAKIELLESIKAVWSPYSWNVSHPVPGMYSFAREVDKRLTELKGGENTSEPT